MTLPKHALRYRKCNITELRRFVEARTGAKPPPSARKAVLIDELEKLDEHAVTDFMEFPGEIRNMIYAELFAGRGGGQYTVDNRKSYLPRQCKDFCLNLLRTSKQVHIEAVRFLYMGKVFELQMAMYSENHGFFFRFRYGHWFDNDLRRDMWLRSNMPHTAAHTPMSEKVLLSRSRLQYIQCIRTRICFGSRYSGHKYPPYAYVTQQSVSDVVSSRSLIEAFLYYCPSLRSLIVKVDKQTGQFLGTWNLTNKKDETYIKTLLQDIIPDLPQTLTLTLEGLSQATVDSFWEQRNDDQPRVIQAIGPRSRVSRYGR